MNTWMKSEGLAFTAFVGCANAGALWVARDWPVRASIGVLVLGIIGVTLALCQISRDLRLQKTAQDRSTFEAPQIATEGKWGNIEIWSWIVGFYLLIISIGFMPAVPLFVLAYSKFYGARWPLSIGLSAVAWSLVYGVFETILHVPWPTPLIYSVFQT
jgi:tripartite tricarboxylate transporter TctB family protein